MMPSMTPVRVRGKRGGTEAEKWRAGKHRKLDRVGSRSVSRRRSSVQSSSSGGKQVQRARPKRHDPELSRLEELPTEVLQAIFLLSANVNMPLVSPRLASQLASNHLYHEITSQILQPTTDDTTFTRGMRDNISRLMNSKFFTWQFFKAWLHDEFQRFDLQEEWEREIGPDNDASRPFEQQEEWIWARIQPNLSVLPPKKLLSRPFTLDKVRFLNFITESLKDDSVSNDSILWELARDGLEQAIGDGATNTLSSFWTMGMHVDTELLRQAVVDAGCQKNLVRQLVSRAMDETARSSDVDFLDPALWSWADRARNKGDARGLWLMDELRQAARESSQKETEVDAKPAILS